MKERLEDRDINIMHLFWATCLKWRSIIAAGIICALLAGGFSYYKNAKAVAAAREAEENPVTTQDLEETTELSAAGKVYLEYLKQYEEQHYYNTHSLLMNLNPNSFYKGEISYYIENHYAVEYPVIEKENNVNGIAAAYRGALNSDEVLEKVAEALDLGDCDRAYAAESIDTKNKYGASNIISTNIEQGLLTVSVYDNDQERCNKLLELVSDSIENAKGEVSKAYGEHDLVLAEKNCFLASDNTLLLLQRDQLDRLRDFSDRISLLEKSLTGEDLSYVSAYKNERKRETARGEESDELRDKANSKSLADTYKATISKKLVVLGFVGGSLLLFVLYALLYILSDRLRLEDDIDKLFGLSSIGIITSEEKKNKGIDGLLTCLLLRGKRLFGRREALEMAAANIAVMSRKSDSQKVYLVGAAYDEKEMEICSSLQESLKKNGVELGGGRCILYDAGSLEKAAEAGAVVVFARAGISPITELAEEMDLLISQKTRILGILVID